MPAGRTPTPRYTPKSGDISTGRYRGIRTRDGPGQVAGALPRPENLSTATYLSYPPTADLKSKSGCGEWKPGPRSAILFKECF